MIANRKLNFTAAGLLALGISWCCTAPAGAADLPDSSQAYGGLFPNLAHRSPGYRGVAGLIAGSVVPGHGRYDANGYRYFGPTLPYPPSPIYASAGCPLAFQPIYDESGNFAGYGGIRACQ